MPSPLPPPASSVDGGIGQPKKPVDIGRPDDRDHDMAQYSEGVRLAVIKVMLMHL